MATIIPTSAPAPSTGGSASQTTRMALHPPQCMSLLGMLVLDYASTLSLRSLLTLKWLTWTGGTAALKQMEHICTWRLYGTQMQRSWTHLC